MKTWLVKELSQLVNVSVKTLHHYDRIGLLKPRKRQDNKYRIYSEQDLLRLQQIIALKYFGFDLKQIAALLDQEKPPLSHFAIQATMLEERAQVLRQASQQMRELIKKCEQDESIKWEETCELIEVFKMAEQLEHPWVKEIYNEEELKQYAEFEKKMKSGHDKAAFTQRWQALVNDLNKSLKHAPNSSVGIAMAERMMSWVNAVYGKEYAHLRTKKMEKGFGEGMGLDDVGFTETSVKWLTQAMDAYWADRIHKLLSQIETMPQEEMLSQWHVIMDDMYGNEEARQKEVIHRVLEDERINEAAKQWVKTLL